MTCASEPLIDGLLFRRFASKRTRPSPPTCCCSALHTTMASPTFRPPNSTGTRAPVARSAFLTRCTRSETNLKRRQALEATSAIRTNEHARDFRCVVDGKMNTANLYNYNGVLRIGDQSAAVGVEQLLLRGSVLRNTDYIYGIVLYVGKETKIMLCALLLSCGWPLARTSHTLPAHCSNLKSSRLKFSSLERRLNLLVVLIFLLNAIVLAISVAMSVHFHDEYGQRSFYLGWPDSSLIVRHLRSTRICARPSHTRLPCPRDRSACCTRLPTIFSSRT